MAAAASVRRRARAPARRPAPVSYTHLDVYKRQDQAVPAAAMGAQQEAVAALMALGYSSAEAARAINQVQGQSDKTDQLIMLALRTLGGN